MKKLNEEAEIKISRARISLQRNHHFFAYLSLFLKPQEVNKVKTMGVDINGNLYYNSDFVNSLRDNEMTSVVCHEILHLALLHISRGKGFNQKIFNIACDIVVNQILKDNNFKLPDRVIWSDNDNNVKIFDKVVKDCNTKTSEEIYYEIFDTLKEKFKEALKTGKVKFNSTGNEGGEIEIDIEDLEGYEFEGSTNNGEGKIKNIDNHLKGKGNELSKEEKEELEKEWTNRVMEAYTGAKMQGNVPESIERLVGKLHEKKVNWKNLLQRYIQSYIPTDFTYSSPSKRSISCGYFMPNTIKEKIEIYVCVDLSGSIGEKEMTYFLSEICGIARTYREKIKFHLWTHETEVNDKYIIENGNVQKILNLKMRGGGGTSHLDCFNKLRNERDCKVCLFFTDGFSDLNEVSFKQNKFDSIFIISENGSEEQLKGKRVKIIKLDR